MPAAAIKGIIISISIITALGVAVLENEQIQAWLEQQRQKLVELLRQIGEELDPQSRRAAEAFAFEGRTPATDPSLRREASGSLEATAIATGRSLSNPSTVRRIPVRGPSDPDEAEERRRKGREYLAQRNQQMYELKERRKSAKADGAVTPPTPTSFEAMVDAEGRLRELEPEAFKGKEKALPTFPSLQDVPKELKSKMKEVEREPVQPLLEGEASSSASAWQMGSQMANPFGDEYALDRSETPKPPVPPKVAIEIEEEPQTPTMPGSFTPRRPELPPQQTDEEQDELTYEEQLAIALSLSEEEAQKTAATAARQVQPEEDDPDLRAAIEASLKDMKDKLSTHTKPAMPPRPIAISQPLVDLTPPSPTRQLYQPAPRGHWETLFDQDYSPIREPLTMARPAPILDEEEDELYRVTPQLTRARLASHDSQQGISSSTTSPLATSNIPYDPVREAAGHVSQQQLLAAMEASFYSAASSAPSPATSNTMDHEQTPQLINISEPIAPPALAAAAEEEARTPISRSFSFRTDNEDDADDNDNKSESTDTFASISAPVSRARSEISNVEVVDLLEDSDVDMLSDEEEGDGIATPDSWTEVGSRDGESEVEDEEEHPNWRLAGL